MSKDLTTSSVARQNVLNNSYALSQLEAHLALGGFYSKRKIYLPKRKRLRFWMLMKEQLTVI